MEKHPLEMLAEETGKRVDFETFGRLVTVLAGKGILAVEDIEAIFSKAAERDTPAV